MWTTFWDSYQSTIHSNAGISDIDKFNYLRSLLDHAALDAIAGLTVSTSNYQQAVEILTKRFGNKQVIISKHMDALMNLETVNSDRNLKDLRRIYDLTETHVRSLKSLGIESASYGALLSPVILAKLPPDLRLIVSRKVSDSNLDMDTLLSTFEEELTARERANSQLSRRSQEKSHPTSSTLLSGSQDSRSGPQCCYCEQSHPSSSCTTITKPADRKPILKSSGRCFNCLRRGHVSRECKSLSRCQKCKRKHHTSICDTATASTTPSSSSHSVDPKLNPKAPLFQAAKPTSTLCSHSEQFVFLQTARAVIHQPCNSHVSLAIRLILDGGSQKSYISEHAQRLLNLEVTGEQSLSIATFGSGKGSTKVCPIVKVGLCLRGYPAMSLSVYVVPTICEPLIGHSTVSGSIPIFWVESWVLSGPSACVEPGHCAMNLTVTHVLRADTCSAEPCTLEDQLRAFWELEALGIQDKEKTLYDSFTEAVKFENGRYKVPLPWREFHDPLPDNYELSLNRLQGLLRRLKQNPAVLKEYDDTIKEQLRKGIIEAAPPDQSPQGNIHYLPHHAVVRQDKSTTKFNQLIFDLLVRFRSYKVALTADLEKAFLMVSVEEADRDVLRFIWVDDISKDSPDLRVYRFTRVVFGVSASPFLLNATIRFHLEKYLDTDENLVRRLLCSTYVDDIIAGGHTEDEAFDLFAKSKRVFGEGGFNLRKFRTNSRSLQERIDLKENVRNGSLPLMDEPTYSEATLGVSQDPNGEEHKVLGVVWNPEADQLIFDVANLAQLALDLHPTKRNLVSLIGKFYDPLGFLSPVIIKFKVLLQKLCQCKYDWDEIIPTDLVQEWKGLISDLNVSLTLTLPRSYFSGLTDTVVSVTLCGFCDASTRAYAAVIYILLKTELHSVVRFVAAKTRVAPLQVQTIPRLELLSAFLLSKLMASVQNSLGHQIAHLNVRCYTDSQVALFWIRGKNKEWKSFIQNRVNEIRHLVQPDVWHHCPGVTNPADLPSRGLTLMELSASHLWRNGPDWLRSDVDQYFDIESSLMPELCVQELKLNCKPSHSLLTADGKPAIGDIMCCEEFSEWQRLIRVTAYVVRAVKRFKARKDALSFPSTLTPHEIAHAELLWIYQAQKELVLQRDFDTVSSQLNLFLDDKGIWRCGGRLQNAELSFSTKHPILLPRGHRISSLIVRAAHIHVLHNGVKETLTEVRRKYWIVKGRSLTKAILFRCTICRRYEGAALKGPPPPPLPEFRVKEEPAYTYTGVDFAGPLFVRSTVTRAIHLDIVNDLSTGVFVRCLKRFAARRGLPLKFLSDNGKTFKAAARFLDVVFKDDTVQEYLSARGIQWIFNVECAPWWGGVFERMDELHTAVVEIEAVINSRPLSYVSSADFEEPLTPSHLVVGRRLLNLPDYLGYVYDPDDEDFEVNASQLKRRMKHLANVLNHFWKRWRTEYLSELRECHQYSAAKKTSHHPSVSCGDIVIVHDESIPRGFWKLGQVQEVHSGPDGLPRSALVRVVTRDRQHTLLKRPLQLLYPLEIDRAEPPAVPSKDVSGHDVAVTRVDQNQNIDVPVPKRYPVRAAAEKANQRLKLRAAQEEAAEKGAKRKKKPYRFRKKAHEEQSGFNEGLDDHLEQADRPVRREEAQGLYKVWNKFDSWCFLLAGLLKKENAKLENIHFICTSNKVSVLELAVAPVQELKLLEDGIVAYDAAMQCDVPLIFIYYPRIWMMVKKKCGKAHFPNLKRKLKVHHFCTFVRVCFNLDHLLNGLVELYKSDVVSEYLGKHVESEKCIFQQGTLRKLSTAALELGAIKMAIVERGTILLSQAIASCTLLMPPSIKSYNQFYCHLWIWWAHQHQ
eukprot:Em0008g667a